MSWKTNLLVALLGAGFFGGCGEAPPIEVLVAGDCVLGVALGDGEEVAAPPWYDLDEAPACIGNNDGTITAEEMPAVIGGVVTYSVNDPAGEVAVSTLGKASGGGGWEWDFSPVGPLYPVAVTVSDPGDYWFAPHFPDSRYAAPLSLWEPELLALFKEAPGAVQMVGLASAQGPDQRPDYTLLVYDEPVEVYRFPLTVGTAWKQKATFSGAVLKGVKNAGTEEYSFIVDGRGTVRLPQFELANTLRLRLEVKQSFVISQGSPEIRHRRFFFVHECLGEVARIVSRPGELESEFGAAAEFRRLGW